MKKIWLLVLLLVIAPHVYGQETPVVKPPEVAPAPAAVVDVEPGQTATVVIVEGIGDRVRKRKLGFTRVAAVRAAIAVGRAGELVPTKGLQGEQLEAAKKENAEAIAARVVLDHASEWQTIEVGEGRDWAAFFEALADFLERIMPLIQMIIDMFSQVTIDSGVQVAGAPPTLVLAA